MPLCGTHRLPVGDNRDLCPTCAARVVQTGTVTIATPGDDDLATLTPDDGPPTLFDVATAPHVTRIR